MDRNRSDGKDKVYLYIDGILAGSRTGTAIGNIDDGSIYVGRDDAGTAAYRFAGQIDDIRIYQRRIKSRAERQQLAYVNPPIPLTIANSNLELHGSSATADGCLVAGGLTWTLPDILGGGQQTFNEHIQLCPDPDHPNAEPTTELTNNFPSGLEFGTDTKKASFGVTGVTLSKRGDQLVMALAGNLGLELLEDVRTAVNH